MAMNVENEIDDLKRRVAELEGSFTYIVGQLREVSRYMHTQFDGVRTDLGNFRAEVNGHFAKVEADIAGLREDLPGLVTDAVRSGLRPG
jgi:hypothetical protein